MARFKFVDLKDEYSRLWASMEIRPEKSGDVANAASRITRQEALYRQVMERTSVPWLVVGIIHSMEKDCDATCHIHNGDPLTARTSQEPSGRPPTGNPPFDWVESAVDALTMPGHELHTVGDWPVERIAYELEKYNGWGYRSEPGRGNSAYLWSFTNHYTKGKFIRDHVFDPNVASNQVGAMALLQHLTNGGAKIDRVTAADSAKVVPLATDLFVAEGPFELLPTATTRPGEAAVPDVVEEDEPCRKIREIGQLWEVEVQSRAGPKRRGFARGGLFRAIAPDAVIDVDAFAQLCLNAARLFGTSGHHLIAVADTETNIRNVAAVKGDAAGPFLIDSVDWDAAVADGTTGFNSTSRFEAFAQPFVAARMAADAAKILQPGLPNRLPTSAELYVAHLVGPSHAAKVLSKLDASLQTAMTEEIGIAEFGVLSAVRPWLFDGNTNVKAALEKIARRMDFGYVRADGLFRKVEPDFDPVTASGFAGKLRDKATEEWHFFGDQAFKVGGQKIHSGHTETEPGFFQRIGTYWRVVGDLSSDGRTNKPWSAAFVSFLVKGCGAANKFHESAQHSVYISKAIRDLNDKADVAYWCHRLSGHKPRIGDIVCWARESGVDYDHQKGGDYKGHCDVVVEVRANEVDVIGGNISQSVSKRTLALDANGFVKPVTLHGETLFAIMENKLP